MSFVFICNILNVSMTNMVLAIVLTVGWLIIEIRLGHRKGILIKGWLVYLQIIIRVLLRKLLDWFNDRFNIHLRAIGSLFRNLDFPFI
jgi:hypothetical protein